MMQPLQAASLENSCHGQMVNTSQISCKSHLSWFYSICS